MPEFFRGWKRKFGVVTLVMAYVSAVGWVRSITKWDSIYVNSTRFKSRQIRASFLEWDKDNLEHSFSTTEEYHPPVNWTVRTMRFAIGNWDGGRLPNGQLIHQIVWVVPYWVIVIPLTLLSAYLLLSNPRNPVPKKTAELTSVEGS